MPEVEACQRAAEFENSKAERNHPSLVNPAHSLPVSLHFVYEPGRSYYLSGNAHEAADEVA